MPIIKNVILSIFSVLVIFIIVESIAHFNDSFLNDGFVHYFPDTALRKKILAKRNIITENILILPRAEGRPSIPLVQDSINKTAHPLDRDLGAEDIFFYNKGFCNITPDFKQAPIITVGDSFTYCTAIAPDKAWPKLAGAILGDNFYNLNLGIPGTGLYEYRDVLKEYITPTTRLVIVGIYEGNDLRDAINFYRSPVNLKADNFSEGTIRSTLKIVLGAFYIPNVLWASYKRYFSRYYQVDGMEAANHLFKYYRIFNEVKFPYNPLNSDLDEVAHAELFNTGKITTKEIERLWSRPIKDLNHIAKNNSAKAIFIYIPSAHSAFRPNVIFEDPGTGDLVTKFSEAQQQIFMTICKANKLNCINSVRPFQSYNKKNKEPSHFPINLHLTVNGHELIARLVADFIGSLNLMLLDNNS